jgi:ABC-type sugar transport system substrate-binding protein
LTGSTSTSSARGATNCTEELGISVAEDLLTKNPDLKAIYAACGPPAAGAAQAIKNAGIASDAIVLVGFDFCCGEAEALRTASRTPRSRSSPTKMAELGVDALVKAIRGEKVESLIDSGAALVTTGQHGQLPIVRGGSRVRRLPSGNRHCGRWRSRASDPARS